MKKKWLMFLIFCSISFVGFAETLKYNSFSGEWSYEPEKSHLKYNPFSGKWKYAEPQEKLKFNPFSGKWTYENPNKSKRNRSW